jgi:hypothetical protein
MKISSYNFVNFKVGILYTNEYMRCIIVYLGHKRVIIEF